MSRSTPGRDFLPTRGRSFITVSVVDENGFTQHHGPVEAMSTAAVPRRFFCGLAGV